MKNLWRGLALVVLSIAAVLACDRPDPHRLGAYVPPSTFIAAPSTPGEGALLTYHAGAWIPLDAGATGLALVSNGVDAAPSFSLLGLNNVDGSLAPGNGGAGWITALDVNFASLSAQTLTSDGNYSLGGFTWSKQNTSHESAAMAITSSGLVITPAASSTYLSPVTRTAPILVTSLGTDIPNFTGATPIRIWLYIQGVTGFSCSGATTIQEYAAGVECGVGASAIEATFGKANTVGGCEWVALTYQVTQSSTAGQTTNYTGRSTALLTMPAGAYSVSPSIVTTGTYSSGFSTPQLMQAEASLTGGNSANAAIATLGLASGCNLYIMGMNNNASAVTTTGTIGEIRLDYRP